MVIGTAPAAIAIGIVGVGMYVYSGIESYNRRTDKALQAGTKLTTKALQR